MSYHIEINEYQRRLIMKALTSTDVNQFSQAPGSATPLIPRPKNSSAWYRCLVRSTSTIPPRNWAEALFHVPNVIRHGYARMSAGGDRTAWLGM